MTNDANTGTSGPQDGSITSTLDEVTVYFNNLQNGGTASSFGQGDHTTAVIAGDVANSIAKFGVAVNEAGSQSSHRKGNAANSARFVGGFGLPR